MTIFLYSFLWLFAYASPALAHQVTVFAWVEGDMVKVEGKLPKGKRPQQGTVSVYDGKDRLLLTVELKPDGTASFPLKDWETGYRIVLDIGEGHQSYWILTPYDIEEQRTPEGK